MADVQQGDTVKVHYTGTLEDGTVFDTSREGDPLEFKVGESRIIPGFENAVEGMSPGDSKSAVVPPESGYGRKNTEMVLTVERNRLPEDIDPRPGEQLKLQLRNGQTLTARITAVSDTEVTLDANHPLAGEDLYFDIELVEIV